MVWYPVGDGNACDCTINGLSMVQEPMVGETGDMGDMGDMGETDVTSEADVTEDAFRVVKGLRIIEGGKRNGSETLCEVHGRVGCEDRFSLGRLVVDVALHPTSFLLASITASRSLNRFKTSSPWRRARLSLHPSTAKSPGTVSLRLEAILSIMTSGRRAEAPYGTRSAYSSIHVL